MRPRPVDRVSGLPAFVEGVSVIRGQPIPVIDLSLLLCGIEGESSGNARFVTADSDQRRVALRVDEVVGVRDLPGSVWHELPELIQSSHAHDLQALGSLSGQLLMWLRRTRLLSQEQWAVLGL